MNLSLNEIVFDRYDKATQVLESMKQCIRKFGKVTVEDICVLALADVTPTTHNPTKYGWKDISSVRIEDDGLGRFSLILPDPILLEEEEKDKPDMVNHPPHYISETGMEVIDVIEAFTFDLKGVEATDTGNIIKYICRWNTKNGLQDLKKAQWYLNHLIKHIEEKEKMTNED